MPALASHFLAKVALHLIPPKYVRPHQTRPLVCEIVNHAILTLLKEIILAHLANGDKVARNEIVDYHGVDILFRIHRLESPFVEIIALLARPRIDKETI